MYGALLTKTNRIYRIFNASKHSAQKPTLISPKSQLIICSGIVFAQVIINVIWMLISPPEAIHHNPSREDWLLVCKVCWNLDRLPAFLTSDDFIRSNEIIRTKWPIYEVIRHFVVMIYWYHQNIRIAGDWSKYIYIYLPSSSTSLTNAICFSCFRAN